MPFLTQGKTNWKYILILVILAIIVGGIFGWQLWMAKEESKLPEIKVPEKKPEEKNETANWKTYRNEEYGFEIKYPSFEEWYFTESSTRTGGRVISFQSYPKEPEKKYSIIDVGIEKGYSSIDEWMNELRILFEEPIRKGEINIFVEEVNVGAEKGYKTGIILLPEGFKAYIQIGLFRKGNIFIFTQSFPKECENLECKIFNQMLSTFTLY